VITEQFSIYSYPFFVGLAVGLFYIYVTLQNSKLKLFSESFFKIYLVGLLISSWTGAKLLFYVVNLDKHWLSSDYYNFLLGGGFVFYGGIILGLLYLLVVHKFYSIPLSYINLLIPALALAHSVGRIGCLMAGCCYGATTESQFSIHLHGFDRYPVQIYESIFLLFLFWGLTYLSKQKKYFELLFCFYLIAYGVFRFVIEFFRGDSIRGIWLLDLSTSQLVSFVLVTCGLIGIYIKKRGTYVS
jgi:phosphatidylglycerol:prolipoprotein diacylglycerol transferase